MQFAFTPEQLQMRESVQKAFAQAVPADVVRGANTETPDALWSLVAELGILGINAPENSGGMGLGELDWVLLMEEAGRCALPISLVEPISAIPFLAQAGSKRLIGKICAGTARISIAWEDNYAVDADKADLVLCISGDQVFNPHAPALTHQPALDPTRRLFSVVHDTEETMGGDVAALLDRAILATSAQLLGLGRHVLDMAVAYAKERQQFGRPIGSFQAVQHHLVDALTKLEFAAPVVYRAAWSLHHSQPLHPLHTSMAKIYASEAAAFACRKSLQVHGAIGYTDEYDLQLWMKRIWALVGAWGDPAWHRDRAAEFVLENDRPEIDT